MNSSQEETFQTIMDYFTGRRYKILVSNAPSLVRAEIGSYWSMSRGDAKGEVEATITKRNSGSYLNFHFDFTKEYMAGLLVAAIGAFLLYIVGSLLAGVIYPRLFPFQDISGLLLIFNILLIGGVLFFLAIIMLLEGYSVSRARKRFNAEFDRFTKSLPKKD